LELNVVGLAKLGGRMGKHCRLLHENQIAVWSWSTTNEPRMFFSIELGADALMGDDVQLMLEILNRMRPV